MELIFVLVKFFSFNVKTIKDVYIFQDLRLFKKLGFMMINTT